MAKVFIYDAGDEAVFHDAEDLEVHEGGNLEFNSAQLGGRVTIRPATTASVIIFWGDAGGKRQLDS